MAANWKLVAFDEQRHTATPLFHLPRTIVWDQDINWKQLADEVAHRVANFCTTPPPDEAFFKTQLAILAYDSNRLEGTARIDGSSFAMIQSFIDDSASESLGATGRTGSEAWPDEGGRDPQSPTSRRQWLQFCRATRALLVDAKREPLSIDLLVRIHGIMMQGSTLGENAGALRTGPICAGGRGAETHVFPEASVVEPILEQIVASFNNDDRHPVQRASYLLYELLSVHPFRNGNGRIARLFLSWSLMRDGFPFAVPLSSGHKQSREHYLHSIYRARGQVYGAKQTLAEINAIVLISLFRVIKNYDERTRFSRYVAVDRVECGAC